MTIDDCITVLETQESMLQFESFNRTRAWELGTVFALAAAEKKLSVTICIRLFSGLTLFQYACEGTNLNNESWINRKYNTVRDLETSTLLHALLLKKKGKTLEDKGLDPAQYVACGGGFPIRLKDSGTIGAVLVSGLPHAEDHGLLVECIAAYLKTDNVPALPPGECPL
ncbi:heme-degrading domain-containing protein [Breznakiella homolactica]|uniref:Heme-degrading domain-containing protein n=1 Tax=Breznakiella homolactica TaxID=2798577 RepID=A0A7T8BAX7_9SPIR|nr:heme-degrading domain-containing protein [Breznakiella homolactica]QQO08628.1 heme-degrading domain-containing protein [Breznakiella homolactica]